MAAYEARTKPTGASVEDFIAALPDPRRDEAAAIDAMLRRVSGEVPRMWGPTIIGYGEYHYRYATGHEGDAARIGFSPRKARLVLYLTVDFGEQEAAASELFARLGKHERGKSCLYIRKLADVDFPVLEELAAISWRQMAKR